MSPLFSVTTEREDALAARASPGSDHQRRRFTGRGHPVRDALVVCLHRGVVPARALRWNHVRPHLGPHVVRPRRARDPPAQRHLLREEASRFVECNHKKKKKKKTLLRFQSSKIVRFC